MLDVKAKSHLDISVSPELFRILTYISFMFIIFVGWVLTAYFSNINFHHNPMVDAFGYNNVCVLFDFPPSTYVLPMLYPIVLLFWSAYLISHWLRALFLVKSPIKFGIFTFFSLIQILSAIAFSIIFAINPNEHLTIHYAGFATLILALTLLALINFIYFKSFLMHSTLIKISSITYLVFALIIGTIKLFMRSTFGVTRPLLAVSKDSGYSWSYPAAIYLTALPHTFVSGEFDGGVVCQGNSCSASGHFYDGHKEYPLIAVTNDGGNTWTYPESVYSPANLPKQYGGDLIIMKSVAGN